MKVLLWGDSCAYTTGFGVILRQLVHELIARGHQVHQLVGLDTGSRGVQETLRLSAEYERLGVVAHRPRFPDVIGLNAFDDVFADVRPDVVFLECDPGTGWSMFTHGLQDFDVPTVAHMPVEGVPLGQEQLEAFAASTIPITYTHWGARALAAYELDVQVAPPGVDRFVFCPPFADQRQTLRQHYGWADQYVVMYVATNSGRKAHERIIRALRVLRDQGQAEGLRVYLHTTPFAGYQLGGWNLPYLAQFYGVADLIEFPPEHAPGHGGPAYELAARYQAADLYIHPAKVEGFGMPLAEAMACGLPVICTDDQGNMTEVTGEAPPARFIPIDWDAEKNGALYANVAPASIAAGIQAARDGLLDLQGAHERGVVQAQRYDWMEMRCTLANAIEQAPQVYQPRPQPQPQPNQQPSTPLRIS